MASKARPAFNLTDTVVTWGGSQSESTWAIWIGFGSYGSLISVAIVSQLMGANTLTPLVCFRHVSVSRLRGSFSGAAMSKVREPGTGTDELVGDESAFAEGLGRRLDVLAATKPFAVGVEPRCPGIYKDCGVIPAELRERHLHR